MLMHAEILTDLKSINKVTRVPSVLKYSSVTVSEVVLAWMLSTMTSSPLFFTLTTSWQRTSQQKDKMTTQNSDREEADDTMIHVFQTRFTDKNFRRDSASLIIEGPDKYLEIISAYVLHEHSLHCSNARMFSTGFHFQHSKVGHFD
jgi:hypothetical protein